MKDKNSVFYCSLFVFIVNIIVFVNVEVDATTSQQPSVGSDLNFSSSTTDAIDKTVKGMATNNIDRLMSETIIPSLNNSSPSGTSLGELNSVISSDVISKPINSSIVAMNPPQQSSANNARAIADNGTILLQFQNPTDLDIVNRLEKIEIIIQDYIKRNDVNSTATSIEESNNQIITELSEIKSSLSGSSVLPAATATSIEESNNQIITELSEIKSSLSGLSSQLLAGIISGALVAGIVSAVAVFVFCVAPIKKLITDHMAMSIPDSHMNKNRL